MKNLTNWLVWVSKGSQPLTISVPFHNVNNAHDFIWEKIGKRPISISRINELIQSADQKAEMLKESLRHSHPFMSDKGKRKMYNDIDITISAKIRLVQRFNNLKYKNL